MRLTCAGSDLEGATWAEALRDDWRKSGDRRPGWDHEFPAVPLGTPGGGARMLHIYVDADACPVKEEIYRVARRCGLSVTLVANSWMRTPDEAWLALEVVGDDSDAADDWIVFRVAADDIVITADIPLADRCLKKGAHVIRPNGKSLTEDSIGSVLATRDLMEELRGAGAITGGPPPLEKRDRSQFLEELDKVIQAVRRSRPGS